MTYTLRVIGLKELLAAADAAGPATKKLVRDGLRKSAEPVRREATRLLHADLNPVSQQRYGISVRKVGVIAVEGRKRKTTGKRPDWGKLQMKEALIPAAETEKDDMARLLDNEAEAAYDRLFKRRLA